MSDLLRNRRTGMLAGVTLAAGAVAGTLLVGSSAQAAPAVPAAAAATTTLSAVVDGSFPTTGTNLLVRGQGAVSAGFANPDGSRGTYEVIFNRDVSQCVYTATLGGKANDTPQPAFIGVASRGGNANGVFVVIDNFDGTSHKARFHLTVVC
jgi:hypothetical protein